MKTDPGRFFEDFRLGESIRHATPRTVTTGEAALYGALYGSRFVVQSADSVARALGYGQAPLDDLLVFHTVFGKTVPDVSLNAVANLGYAEARFLAPVYPGTTLSATSDVIGLKENANRETGIVWVRTRGEDETGRPVLDYVRWVMVRKGKRDAPSSPDSVPHLATALGVGSLGAACPPLDPARWDPDLAGTRFCFGDYRAGERIDHVDGQTVEEAEHQMATRLWQNTARVHFDGHAAAGTRFGRRLVYGGHVISIARALSFNGLGAAFHLAAINGGRHVAPLFAGDTVYAWSEILDTSPLPGRDDVGALRIRTIATKNRPCTDHPGRTEAGYDPAVILDLDYWALAIR